MRDIMSEVMRDIMNKLSDKGFYELYITITVI